MTFRLHKEGAVIIPVTLLITVGLSALAFWKLPPAFQWVAYLVAGGCAVFLGLIINFFRNPPRTTPQNPLHILAPCDGKVVVIEDVVEPQFFKRPVKQISVFMSPLNVHVNRNPVGGKVKFYRYFPGKYLVAWHPKSSTDNEQTLVVVENNGLEIGYKQIAGALARRICCYVQEGQTVQQGEEFGFIKFGSRMDIFVPTDAKVLVNLEQKVRGGETLLADLSK